MDVEIARVEAQIQALEGPIEHAGQEFLSASKAGDKDVADYWRKEEEQLRKEEEQLREEKGQLRKKEEQLREEKLKKIQDVTAAIGAAPVINFKEAISKEWDLTIGESVIFLREFKANKADYENVFPSSKGPICSRGTAEPCLLYHEMGKGLVKVDQRLHQRLAGTGSQVTVLLAPSGSGKTRQLIELACIKHCLYFMGCKQLLGSAPGSGDLQAMKNWLEILFPEGQEIPQCALGLGVGVLLLGRLRVLGFLREQKPGLCAREWLFFQLEFPEVFDVFAVFVTRVLLLVRQGTDVFTVAGLIWNMVIQESSRLNWDGFVVLDEAQVVNGWFPNRFPSADQAGVSRSFTNPFLLQLLGAYSRVGKSIFVAGTGRSMTLVAESLLSGNVLEIRKLPGFDSLEEMENYVKQIIDTSRVDMEEIFFTYMGRPRWLVTALERFISQSHTSGQETKYLVDFSDQIVSVT